MEKLKISDFLIGLVVLVVLVLFLINTTVSESLECKSEFDYCKNVTKNMLNMRNENLLLKPNDVKDIDINQYEVSVKETERYGENKIERRHYEPRFSLYFINKSGNSYSIFRDYRNEDSAKAKKDEILTCFAGKHYPCVVDKK